MKMGYKQIIQNDELTVFDNDKLIATGKYCSSTGLIKMDEQINTSNKVSKIHDINHWHNMFGHVGEDIIKNTLKNANIETVGQLNHCDACSRSKMRKSSSKGASTVIENPLEVIESDTKTFPLVSYDNFSKQIKFIDAKTGYIYLEFVHDLKSVTLLAPFSSSQCSNQKFKL